ncbi:MAG: D-alanyl-D-alanine carboxypeptidase/D-alanyl-D-alanine-endopeptidase [Balneolaceae bacterium]|nr:D-alanyl-D-alanine carboxypeptidase/D-alanyl-D-alanine-endopeptidase [Balneolaceae bacterium]
MHCNAHRLSGALAVLLLAAAAALQPAQAQEHPGMQLSEDVQQMIENSRAANAWWSVIVTDTTGRVLESYYPEKLMRPASNLKLLSTAAALDQLGPDYRFETRVWGIGHQQDSTWMGDLVVEGRGDPTISGLFYDEHRFHVFEKFYSTLDSLGIRRIRGNLVGNDAYFERQVYPKGWSWEDLTYYYGVEISALSFNNNAVDLQVFADRPVGEKPRIQWFPFDTDYVTFVNEQVITPPDTEFDEFYRRELGTNIITLGSKVPRNHYEEESLAVHNASLYFMDTFLEYLRDGGMTVDGRMILEHQPRDFEGDTYTLLTRHRSPPLRLILQETNKESNNFYMEMLMKTMAAERYDEQGSTELGLGLIENFAHEMGMDTTRVELTDAAGMSPATLLTAEDLNRLLVGMQSHPHFDTWRNSLAIAGVDGSISHRFQGTPLAGNLRGKTGYVSGVRALSGYLEAASGRPLIFTMMTNHYTARTTYLDWLHERILRHWYEDY